MLNRKGQTMGLAIISAIFIFIIGFVCINFLFDEISNTRINLQCSSPEIISDGTKLICLVVDTTVMYWILGILSITIGAITSRVVL